MNGYQYQSAFSIWLELRYAPAVNHMIDFGHTLNPTGPQWMPEAAVMDSGKDVVLRIHNPVDQHIQMMIHCMIDFCP